MNKKVEVYLDAIDKIVKLEVVYTVENTGIGRYEFWGAECFDFGFDEIILGNIELVKDGLSEDEYDLVCGLIEHLDSDDELYAEIVNIVNDKID